MIFSSRVVGVGPRRAKREEQDLRKQKHMLLLCSPEFPGLYQASCLSFPAFGGWLACAKFPGLQWACSEFPSLW